MFVTGVDICSENFHNFAILIYDTRPRECNVRRVSLEKQISQLLIDEQ